MKATLSAMQGHCICRASLHIIWVSQSLSLWQTMIYWQTMIHCHATNMLRIQATHRHKAKVWRRSMIPVAADWRSFASALTISSFQMRSSNLWWGSLSWSALNAFSHSLSSKSKSYSTKCSSLCPMPPVANTWWLDLSLVYVQMLQWADAQSLS